MYIATARAKEVAELVKKQKREKAFGPMLSKDQVC